MRIETTFFRSKVARRIFLLFIVCALVPILVLCLISFREISVQMEHDRQIQLRQSSKAEAMAIYSRLELLSSELQIASTLGKLPNSDNDHFLDVRLDKNFEQAEFSQQEKQQLLSGKAHLKTIPAHNSESVSLLMVRLLDPHRPMGGMIIGKIMPDYLWDKGSLPVDVDVCV